VPVTAKCGGARDAPGDNNPWAGRAPYFVVNDMVGPPPRELFPIYTYAEENETRACLEVWDLTPSQVFQHRAQTRRRVERAAELLHSRALRKGRFERERLWNKELRRREKRKAIEPPDFDEEEGVQMEEATSDEVEEEEEQEEEYGALIVGVEEISGSDEDSEYDTEESASESD
jgi:hypothetical protein